MFNLDRVSRTLPELTLPDGLTVLEALGRVLRLPSVASKRYLTVKVDRSVTGLVAQQQCVGPLHTPLADVAVIALYYFDNVSDKYSYAFLLNLIHVFKKTAWKAASFSHASCTHEQCRRF